MTIYEPDKLQAIIEENDAHNEGIGTDVRPRDRARRDAEYVYMHRHKGITVETLCMMLTDYEFALKQK